MGYHFILKEWQEQIASTLLPFLHHHTRMYTHRRTSWDCPLRQENFLLLQNYVIFLISWVSRNSGKRNKVFRESNVFFKHELFGKKKNVFFPISQDIFSPHHDIALASKAKTRSQPVIKVWSGAEFAHANTYSRDSGRTTGPNSHTFVQLLNNTG